MIVSTMKEHYVNMIYNTFFYRLIIISFCLVLASCFQNKNIVIQHNPTEKENIIDGIVWESGNWKPDLPAGEKGKSWGNHRAVVKIKSYSRFLGIRIDWRRSDNNPKDKAVIVIDAQSGEQIINIFLILSISILILKKLMHLVTLRY